MLIYRNKSECSGCKACLYVCPKNAIDMIVDVKGFEYPMVADEKCVKCNKCVKVCHQKQSIISEKSTQVYGIKNRNDEIREASSSGGFFNELMEYVINNGGYVFGAIYDHDFNVIHKGTNSLNEGYRFKGSKYVKSDTKKTYLEVKELLEVGNLVLYSGTPCQIHGLKMYLGNVDLDNLITCDNVCHGTPSPKIFKEYREALEEKYNSKITELTFRYKVDNSTQNMSVTFENNCRYIAKNYEDTYYKLFLENINLRDCCFSCKYSNVERISDFTMADFWGIEKINDEFEDGKGVSLILVNSNKARLIFNSIQCKFNVIETTIDKALQINLIHPSIASSYKDTFWSNYSKMGYRYAIKRYNNKSIAKVFKKYIKIALIKVQDYIILKKRTRNG